VFLAKIGIAALVTPALHNVSENAFYICVGNA